MELNNALQEQLSKIKGSLKNYATLNYNDEESVAIGIKPDHETQNKVFVFRFSEEDVIQFNDILSKIKKSNSRSNRENIRSQLLVKCDEMLQRQISPVECLLYSTKIINKTLSDEMLKDLLADVVADCVKRNNICTISMKNILDNWKWTNQVNIVIRACGKAGLTELLEEICNKYSKINEYKYSCFIALMNSKNHQLLNYIFEILVYYNDELEDDKKIKNYFSRHFVVNFQEKGIEELRNILSSKNLHRAVQNTIDSIIGSENNIIEKARNSNHGNSNDVFSDCKRIITSNKNAGKRIQAFMALGHLNSTDVGPFIIKHLANKNHSISSNEKTEAILTLGFLKYSAGKDYLHELASQRQYKYAANGALLLMGEKGVFKKIIMDYFEEDDVEAIMVAKRVLRRLRNKVKSPENKRDYIQHMNHIFTHYRGERLSLAIYNFKDLITYCGELYFNDLNDGIFQLFGYQQKRNNSDDMGVSEIPISVIDQNYMLDTLTSIIDKKNSNKFHDFLFYLFNNDELFKKTIRGKAQVLLTDQTKFEGKAIVANTKF
ncbi:hypothetical protein [Evansella tamaricis]|uniref:Uncharacterized protein n=1 Tax=Evansella tamaricis TaxID=2069301 RepID=A0ABS6JJY3_9BACI|nr:hypothetical protein [Evansella tamaricis]MBU9713853.1 hypothetical protein [Evansella tamaricis]